MITEGEGCFQEVKTLAGWGWRMDWVRVHSYTRLFEISK